MNYRSSSKVTSGVASRSELAFTLIELLIALSVLGVAAVTIFGLESAILAGTARSDDRIRATTVARQVLAELEAHPPQTAPFTSEGSLRKVLAALGQKSPPFLLEESRFTVSANVQPWEVQLLPSGSVWMVTVTVKWGASVGDTLKVSFLMANPAITEASANGQ